MPFEVYPIVGEWEEKELRNLQGKEHAPADVYQVFEEVARRNGRFVTSVVINELPHSATTLVIAEFQEPADVQLAEQKMQLASEVPQEEFAGRRSDFRN